MSRTSPDRQTTSRKLKAASVLLVALTLLVFSPAITSQFTNWDDPVLVTENPVIRSLSWENIGQMFSFSSLDVFKHYIPLVLLSYAFDYAAAGLDATVFHTTNVSLHALTAVLVLWLSFRLTRSVPIALLVAALFAFHPMRVESVAWITERKDVLSGMMFFGSLLAYSVYARNPLARRFFFLASGLFLLSLLSKAMAVSLPVVFLLFDILEGRKLTKAVVLEKVPLLLLSVGAAVLALVSQAPSTGTPLQQISGGEISFSFLERFVIAGYSVAFYLWKMAAPIDLSALYQLPVNPDGSFSLIMPLSLFIVVMLLALLVLFRRRSPPLVLFGLGFFLVTLVPVSQLIPAGVAGVADRFTYIPYFGLFLAFAVAGREVVTRWRTPSVALLVLMLTWLSALAFLTFQRTSVWKDSITLWNSVLEKPDPPPMAYVHRALAYTEMRRLDEALADYSAAIASDSSLAVAWNNRGNIYARLGRPDAALADYRQAVEAFPMYTDAFLNMASSYLAREEYQEALENCHRALAIDPQNALAFSRRGQIYELLGKPEDAINDYHAALRARPDFAEGYVRRADWHFRNNDFRSALPDYHAAIRLGLSSPTLHINRGSTYANLKSFDEAILDFTRALELDPGSLEAFRNRGLAYLGKGNYAAAYQHFARLEELGFPQDPSMMRFLEQHRAGGHR